MICPLTRIGRLLFRSASGSHSGPNAPEEVPTHQGLSGRGRIGGALSKVPFPENACPRVGLPRGLRHRPLSGLERVPAGKRAEEAGAQVVAARHQAGPGSGRDLAARRSGSVPLSRLQADPNSRSRCRCRHSCWRPANPTLPQGSAPYWIRIANLGHAHT